MVLMVAAYASEEMFENSVNFMNKYWHMGQVDLYLLISIIKTSSASPDKTCVACENASCSPVFGVSVIAVDHEKAALHLLNFNNLPPSPSKKDKKFCILLLQRSILFFILSIQYVLDAEIHLLQFLLSFICIKTDIQTDARSGIYHVIWTKLLPVRSDGSVPWVSVYPL